MAESPPSASKARKELKQNGWISALCLAGIVVLGVLGYSNSFDVPFVFDDRFWIVDNPTVQNMRSAQDLVDVYWGVPNRIVGILTLVLNYRLGGLDVAGYHAFNLGVHIATALLVFALVRLTFLAPRMRASALRGRDRLVAFASAAIFVAHPIQTQAVTYIVQRFTSLATFFFVLAMVIYAWWRTREGGAPTGWPVRFAVGLAMVATILLAMKSKEIAFTLPFCVLLYEVVFFGLPQRAQMPFLVLVLATIPVIPLSHVRGGVTIADAISTAATVPADAPPVGRIEYARTQVPVVGRYLSLLVWPRGQNIDHDVQAVASLLEARFLFPLLGLAALAAIAVALWRAGANRGSGPPDPIALLVAFGVGWFFLALSVESTFIPIPDVIAEHRVYLPSVGFAMAVAAGLCWAAARALPGKGAAVGALVASAMGLSMAWATFQRNELWRDEVRLWEDAAAKSPRKARTHVNVASALARRGQADAAIQRYRIAIALDPYDPEVRNNMGIACFKTGRVDEAIGHFEAAIRLKPDFGNAHYNLGIAFGKMGRTKEAMESMSRGLMLGSTPRH